MPKGKNQAEKAGRKNSSVPSHPSFELAFTRTDGKDAFTVTTTKGSFTQRLRYIDGFWVKKRLADLDLNPEETINQICEKYFEWRTPRK